MCKMFFLCNLSVFARASIVLFCKIPSTLCVDAVYLTWCFVFVRGRNSGIRLSPARYGLNASSFS